VFKREDVQVTLRSDAHGLIVSEIDSFKTCVIVSDCDSLENITETTENIVAKEGTIMVSMTNGNGLHSLTKR
jgi:hypothetical protein